MSNTQTNASNKHEYMALFDGVLTTLSGLSFTVKQGETFFVDSSISPSEVLSSVDPNRPKARLVNEAKVKPKAPVEKMNKELTDELKANRKIMTELSIDSTRLVSHEAQLSELKAQNSQLMDILSGLQTELALLRETKTSTTSDVSGL